MSKIKICGLRRSEDISFVNELRPDYIGFVFAKSKRQVSPAQAAKLKSELDRGISAVGVFVDEPIENVLDLCRSKTVDVVQLHGNEDSSYIDSLRKKITQPIIKAVRVQNAEQILQAEKLSVDYLLLDAYNPKLAGGTGEVFNWDIIPKNLYKPFFLAGGLSAENIARAIKTVQPYCVDLSGSVETDGFKDREKIKTVIEIVRKED
ncbi:MAG: phosphoribosylanthranilate isomerase [Ruminococcus sp.]|nr:phosphoribosylanthranilate isomerase [Ruminococcus sp.]